MAARNGSRKIEGKAWLRRGLACLRLLLLVAFLTSLGWGGPSRTEDDLLVGGAPIPDRSQQDQVLGPGSYRSQFRVQVQTEEDQKKGLDARIRRARWIQSYKPAARWALRSEVGLNNEEFLLRDLYATYELKRWSRLWVGQFKSILSRSYLSSSGGLLFSERPLAVRAFIDSDFQETASSRADRLQGHGGGRTPRIRLTNYWYFDEGDRSGDELGIRLRAEVSKGHTIRESSGDPVYTFRLELHPDGNPSYQEGNLAAVKQGRLSFDLAYQIDPGQVYRDLDGDGLETDRDRVGRRISNLGFVYRRDRFSSQGELFRQKTRPTHSANLGAEVESHGSYTQMGWTFVPFQWEMGFRHSHLNPDVDRPGDRREERAISVVRYLNESATKLLFEWVRTTDEARTGSGPDRVLRLQFQATF